MAAANPTNFSNDAGTGTVQADGFIGPVTGNVTGNVTGDLTGNLLSVSRITTVPALVNSAGSTQGDATALAPGFTIVTTVGASSEGVRLPATTVGRFVAIMNNTTLNVNVYPPTGDIIGVAATNAAVPLAANTGAIYIAKDDTTWALL